MASSAYGHHYDASLYSPLQEEVDEVCLDRHVVAQGWDAVATVLDRIDILHVHWPERLLPPELHLHQRLVNAARQSGVRILLTQHNLEPHDRSPCWRPVYDIWASAADAVIHHTAAARDRARGELNYRAEVPHYVVLHGHWGKLVHGVGADVRRDLEREMGLARNRLRLGVIGAPRLEKDTQLVIDAVVQSTRSDIELLITCGTHELQVPADTRIRVLPYRFEPRAVFNRRLAALDILVLPFANGRMLATGTVGDALALGLPSLISPWPFLSEMLGDAGLPYGSSASDLVNRIDRLTDGEVAAARAACVARRPQYDWAVVARAHLAVLEELGAWKV